MEISTHRGTKLVWKLLVHNLGFDCSIEKETGERVNKMVEVLEVALCARNRQDLNKAIINSVDGRRWTASGKKDRRELDRDA